MRVHREHHAILVKLDAKGKLRSNYRPWPDPKIAVMCSYGWVERIEPNGDFIVMTASGREMLNNAEVV